ncbi:hypothetical protein GY45DRAFT_239809 [Cubamyces sp. BRFM 1775]|nr:hypothetical protein GY45DRAFT_239809 [Cubamyces sp. BRFM 1775]
MTAQALRFILTSSVVRAKSRESPPYLMVATTGDVPGDAEAHRSRRRHRVRAVHEEESRAASPAPRRQPRRQRAQRQATETTEVVTAPFLPLPSHSHSTRF